ncbi:MAG: DNA translocase FtsK, partial [Kiritimatiellae bacterium]|nr:DNA translocase FtsK [Kiritimatiellia bacterium]
PAENSPYELPPLSLLDPPSKSQAEHGDVDNVAASLVATLARFGVETELVGMVTGPVVTQYKLRPALDVKVERIPALSGNLQMTLEAKSLRIQAPIPGENCVGIEVPNPTPSGVAFGDLARSSSWQKAVRKFHVPLLLGKDAAGNDLMADLSTMPHLLIAGATGQGKSVCLNSIINGFLMSRAPEQLKLIMVDPKRVEFTSYCSLPHLLVPIVNDTNKVVFALKWAVAEMDKRLKMFNRCKCRNIVDFNTRTSVSQPDLFGGEESMTDSDLPNTIPYIVIIIDEVADIMQTNRKEVEPVVARLTALARATGIHLILATQRPDAKIITGVIKSNIPGRIAFKTSSSIDSRTILDETGSENLIGRGDMLFKTKEGALVRAQGSYISDPEINRITDFIAAHASVQFDEAFAAKLAKVKEADAEDLDGDDEEEQGASSDSGSARAAGGSGGDEMQQKFIEALEIVRVHRRASTSFLQRKLSIGYNHASRLIEKMEDDGIIGPVRGAGPREILVDLDAYIAQLQSGGGAPAEGGDGAADAIFNETETENDHVTGNDTEIGA